MTKQDLALVSAHRTRADVPADRLCLRCSTTFWSEGFGERVCRRCKATVTWKSALPPSAGQARRR